MLKLYHIWQTVTYITILATSIATTQDFEMLTEMTLAPWSNAELREILIKEQRKQQIILFLHVNVNIKYR